MPSSFCRIYDQKESSGAFRLLLTVLLFLLVWGGVAGGGVIRDLTDLSQDPLSYVDLNAADTCTSPPGIGPSPVMPRSWPPGDSVNTPGSPATGMTDGRIRKTGSGRWR
jgi:hypothetical protein